ncbi:hypothetical protein BH11PLA2_BH11PLA2_34680 [soil metagenome]
MLPFMSCLCPTYNRPAALANAIACYLGQDWPADRSELIILDDSGQFPFVGDGVRIPGAANIWLYSVAERFEALPEKFNWLATWSVGEILVVWEDDDTYLPTHLAAHANALQEPGSDWSKPGRVLSDYPGYVVEEGSAGRFHGSLAFTAAFLRSLDGWPVSHRADFDQQLIGLLKERGRGVDPTREQPPSYIWRWHTNHYHGQGTMSGPGDETWYQKAAFAPGTVPLRESFPVPQFDLLSAEWHARYWNARSPARSHA